jgi:hypothetical protein
MSVWIRGRLAARRHVEQTFIPFIFGIFSNGNRLWQTESEDMGIWFFRKGTSPIFNTDENGSSVVQMYSI